MTEFYVKVVPEQDEHRIDTSGTYPTIDLIEPTSQGRANKELVSFLSDVIGAKIGIISGHNSRRKKLVADCLIKDITEKTRCWLRRMTSHGSQSVIGSISRIINSSSPRYTSTSPSTL